VESGCASHGEVAAWCVDNGLITSVRPGETAAAAIRRSLADRIGTRMDAIEAKLGKFTLQFVPSLLEAECSYSIEEADRHGMLRDYAVLELHRDTKKMHEAIIGPSLLRMESAQKGAGKAVSGLLHDLYWQGCGAFDCWDALDEASRCHWGGEENEEMQLSESMAGDEKSYEGMTRSEARDKLGIPCRGHFQMPDVDDPKAWSRETPGDVEAYPKRLRPLAEHGLALLAEARHLVVPHADNWRKPCLNEAVHTEMRSYSSAPPVILSWTEHDPTARMLDDANQSDYESGEMMMGFTAAFLFPAFPIVDPAAFAAALRRLNLWIEITQCALDLTARLHTVTAMGLEAE
jgi:PRTRC genetic system protein F